MPKPEHELREIPFSWKWPGWPGGPGGGGPATDITDMDHLLQDLDDVIRIRAIAARFEMVAALHRTKAEAATKIAGIIAQGKRE